MWQREQKIKNIEKLVSKKTSSILHTDRKDSQRTFFEGDIDIDGAEEGESESDDDDSVGEESDDDDFVDDFDRRRLLTELASQDTKLDAGLLAESDSQMGCKLAGWCFAMVRDVNFLELLDRLLGTNALYAAISSSVLILVACFADTTSSSSSSSSASIFTAVIDL